MFKVLMDLVKNIKLVVVNKIKPCKVILYEVFKLFNINKLKFILKKDKIKLINRY